MRILSWRSRFSSLSPNPLCRQKLLDFRVLGITCIITKVLGNGRDSNLLLRNWFKYGKPLGVFIQKLEFEKEKQGVDERSKEYNITHVPRIFSRVKNRIF
jgi:hypothetical protein